VVGISCPPPDIAQCLDFDFLHKVAISHGALSALVVQCHLDVL